MKIYKKWWFWLLIVVIIFIGYYFLEMSNSNLEFITGENICTEDSQCVNTCCGCLNKEQDCNVHCFVLPKRKCVCYEDRCIEELNEELINNEEEAIDFAKQNKDVKLFVENAKGNENFIVEYNAYFNEEQGVWHVSISIKDMIDVGQVISFYPNKTIISEDHMFGW